MSGAIVLDSYALLALLRDEAGGEAVARILERAGQRDQPVQMTEVNYAEVQYVVRRKDGEAAWASVARELGAVPIEFHPVDRRLAEVAADLKTRFRLSLADACAAALAKELRAELVTGDPEFKALEEELKIRWLT
jgi:ribonuclease VapC